MEDTWPELRALVRRLRAPDGCPWDRRQTLQTMRTFVLEEAHEVVDAIDRGDLEALREELGDLLFVTTFIAELAAEEGAFTLRDAARDIEAKMVERHPHVFAPGPDRPGAAEVQRDWEARKARARTRQEASVLDGVPTSLPALMRAHQVSKKAAAVGFDWPEVAGVRAKVDEELAELDEALDRGEPVHISEEYGDLLFTLVNLGRFLHTDGETALREATMKFERRFRSLESQARAEGLTLGTLGVEELERRWQLAKERG